MDNKGLKLPVESFDKTLESPALNDLPIDYLESGLDFWIGNDLLKDVPIIKTVLSIAKFAKDIQGAFFAKKIYKFLFQIKDIDEEEKRNALARIDNDKDYLGKVSETLLVIIDRLNHDIKAEIIGQLFKAVLTGQIDYDIFLRLSHTIELCFVGDLIELAKSWNGVILINEFSDQLLILNIIDQDFVAGYKSVLNGTEQASNTTLTDLGKILVEYGLKKYLTF